jgi:GntR family transcriptional repressor for pyruvate dehydrogenase complex
MSHSVIKRQNIYEQVVEHLKQYIIENALQPGDTLPTELELAAKLRVSRQSVREAVKVLESVGIVETQPRHGSRLKKASPRHVSEHLWFHFALSGVTYAEMAVSRRVIECSAMSVVTQHADERDFARLEAILTEMRQNRYDITAFSQSDAEFHQALFAATKNRVLAGFGAMVQEFFHRMLADQEVAFTPELQQKSVSEHERILLALRNRDAETAENLMRIHLSVYDESQLQRPEARGETR